jgi:hypothetical protein
MRDGDVTFLYADPRTGEYLRISGEAKDIRTLNEILDCYEKLWENACWLRRAQQRGKGRRDDHED